MGKDGYSREGLFGEIIHYDHKGHKIGESWPERHGRGSLAITHMITMGIKRDHRLRASLEQTTMIRAVIGQEHRCPASLEQRPMAMGMRIL